MRGAAAKDERAGHAIRIPVTEKLRERMEARAAEGMRSLSSYVARVIVGAVGR